MGVIDWLLGTDLEPVLERQETGDTIEDQIARAISERQATFSMADALAMPPVARAVDLITSTGSTFVPVEYLDGAANEQQPRFLRRPDPFRSRQQFLEQTLWEIIDRGEAWWLLGDQDSDGYPSYAQVLPYDEVQVEWDNRQFRPLVRWRGRSLQMGVEVTQVAINLRAGKLHGRSVLREALPYLATFDAAEQFAALSYGSGGVPLVVLKAANKLTKDEADKLKASWAASRQAAAATGEPAVLSMGLEADYPDVDPSRMELTSSRQYAATTVARLMGIPSALLLVELHGSSVQYTNVESALAGFVRTTLLPRYLAPIEAALSDLVPRTKSVRFSTNEIMRTDVATRYEIYAQAIEAGVITTQEARNNEGLPDTPPGVEMGAQFAPTPAAETDPSTRPASEVPASVS